MDCSRIRILLIDPNREFASAIENPLRERGYHLETVRTPVSAIHAAQAELQNLIFKPYVSALNEKREGLMEQIRAICPDTQFIFLSPLANVQMAMRAIRRGAFDCLPLPCEREQLEESVQRALRHQKLVGENLEILGRLENPDRPNILAGRSARLREIQETIERVADTDVTVLIEGESGTGKELVARTLHDENLRKNGPFIAVNCAALADSIIESELFGHLRGAFTGAIADKPGRFDLARGGTLFLDEIGDLSPLGQADLLRVLEDGIFRPLGSLKTVHADVRVIAATNRNLEERCREGSFREDLLYRLNVITISIPPLRERPEDILSLAAVFLQHFCTKHRRPAKTLSEEVERHLAAFAWPGNVRQLRNVMERMVLMAPSRCLTLDQLPSHLRTESSEVPVLGLRCGLKLADVERQLITVTLEGCRNNRTEAARLLGISRRTLHYHLVKQAIT